MNKAPEEWIRLDGVRWLNESGTAMEKLENDIVGTENDFYIRSRAIVGVAPLRKEAQFWAKGEPPIQNFVESLENN